MNIQHKSGIVTSLLIIFSLSTSPKALAQAYCALRDPVHGLGTLFPKATNHRSIVKTIDEETKATVEKELPPNTLHFAELGRHTLYVAMEGKRLLGLLHVRSEQSEWGLVEIAWAMDLDLKITDYAFQRIRSRYRELVEGEEFRKQFQGKSFEQIKTMFKVDSNEIDTSTLQIPADAEELVKVLVRSAAKTLLVTRIAWSVEIKELKMLQTAQQYFPDVNSILIAENHYTPQLKQQLAQQLGVASLGFNRDSASVVKVLDRDNAVIGAILTGDVEIDEEKVQILWAVNSDKRVSEVTFPDQQPSQRSKTLFQSLLGEKFIDLKHCSNRAELMGYEAILTLGSVLENNKQTPQRKY